MKERDRLKQLSDRTEEERHAKHVFDRKKKKKKLDARKGTYAAKLQQAGLSLTPSVWFTVVLGMAVVCGFLLSHLVGSLVGVSVGVCGVYFFIILYPAGRADKRRRNVVPQLPGFVDTLGASLNAGYNMELALGHATNSLPDGVLRVEFKRVMAMMDRSITLDEGMDYVVRRISGQEILSLVITIRLFHDMGGRTTTPFQRLGHKIRAQQSVLERAGRDLVGTKQAFYVIFALALTAPLILFVTEPEYLMEGFDHPIISYVMQGSIVVQVVCLMVFKKFTTLCV